jgi:hypothetical protein
MFKTPTYSRMGSTSVFNPRYNTVEQIEEKYQTIMNSNPLPLIKIISNHDFSMVERILQSNYKTVFIYPDDLRKQVLKVLVAKKTDSFVDKNLRKNHIGKLVITPEEIIERLEYYKIHMTFKNKCDYVASDKSILNNPTELITSMGLEYMGTKYKYKQYEIKDEDMLQNIDEFNKLYEECVKDYDSTYKTTYSKNSNI